MNTAYEKFRVICVHVLTRENYLISSTNSICGKHKIRIESFRLLIFTESIRNYLLIYNILGKRKLFHPR
ncbi:hypothetical protein LEP1GSC052_0372 [Leptospira kmetyi serovar Malaysia str. Bejo-Iso9]|nr:hypothetical protein LEP1GSC052_0372 [Leptospira kmetyi serovar Malaysia str. Bejo-Iso9]